MDINKAQSMPNIEKGVVEKLAEFRKVSKTFISDEDFNEELKSVWATELSDFAKNPNTKRLCKFICIGTKDSDGKRPMIVVGFAVDGEDWDDWDKRKAGLKGLGVKIHEDEFDLCAIFNVSEAWVSTSTKEEGVKVTPSKDPNRKEAIVVVGQTIDGRANMSVAVFDDKRNIVELQETPYTEDEKMVTENRMANAIFEGYLLSLHKKLSENKHDNK